MSLMGRGIAEEALVLLRRRLCDLNFIFSLFSDSPDNNYSKLKFIVSNLVTEGVTIRYCFRILEDAENLRCTMANRKEHLLPPKPTSAINLYGVKIFKTLYSLLQTAGKAGAYTYNIHFWLGKDANQDEARAAAVRAVERDSVLGNRAVEYRELQVKTPEEEEEKEKEDEEEDGEEKEEKEKPEPRLYTCKGKRVVRLKQVPFTRSTLNHDEMFILDTKDKIFMFNGANTNVQERFKALDVVQNMKERYHEGNCNVAIVDEGKLQSEGPSAEFWALFGGFALIGGKKVSSDDDIIPEKTPPKLYCIVRGQFQEIEGELSKSSLHNDRCYLLYSGTDLFIWVVRTTPLPNKKFVMHAAEEFILKENLPKSTPITRSGQGHETSSFKSNFASWSAASAPEETRGKVAALLKQQGAFAKGQTKTAPVEEEVPPLLGENGKIEVWRIDGEEKTELPKEDIGKFYSGDCYICLYSYHSDEKKEDHYLCCWIGKDSIQEDQKTAVQQTTSMFNSMKCKPVQGRMHQGKEAPQFVAIFQPMVVLKGGLSSSYKNYIAKKGLHDETYSPDTAALIEISGTSQRKLEIEEVHSFEQDDLFPEDVLILDTHAEVIVWVGHLAQSTEKQNAFETGEKYVELAASMDSLSPSVILYRVIEGNEPCFFTTYFSWDPAKTTAHGNAFHKKAVQLFGSSCVAEPPRNKLSGVTERASAMAALTSAFSKSTTAPRTPQHGPPPRMLALILTGSPDCSILAIDIETGSPVSYGWMFIQLGMKSRKMAPPYRVMLHNYNYNKREYVVQVLMKLTRIGRDAVLYVESLIESIMGGLEGLINILDSEGGFASTRSQLKLQMAFDGQERYMKILGAK
ncbi:hypothetical protein Lser_V15G45496 [Lactuca serriola]